MNDHELDQLLRTTGHPEMPPVGFQRDVWSRIEAAETLAWKPRIKGTLERLFGFFALPPVALATCAAMVLAGAWFGSEAGKPNPASEVAYVRSISPFAQTHP